ncbi:EAL domain-containing protein [Bradyrhizobium sp. LHD-71]|uniref:EAL domain-containing protein n=1 Tax=Bradyrhizobium sp. LHD-71 TaxID=3072141 RepID=UPI00280E08AE|nr:EAL domain-containing protein [Bradyrhizobium sp. LHD-71]MDQ8729974.1 EAL domain-containing protein [Bradyrhizobium sp. LHD-71]
MASYHRILHCNASQPARTSAHLPALERLHIDALGANENVDPVQIKNNSVPMINRILTSGILREPAVLAVCALAFALPLLVTLYLASTLVDLQYTRNWQSVADRLVLWGDETIERADAIIRQRLSAYPQGCPSSYSNELAGTVFANENVSALGIVRNGKVICAHRQLRAESLLVPEIAGIPADKTVVAFTPKDATYRMPAIVVARRLDADAVGVALIEPKYFLLPLGFIPEGSRLKAALLGPNGEVYAGDTSLAGANRPGLAKTTSHRHLAIATSTRFPISIAVRSDAQDDRLHWHQALPYALAAGLLLGLSSSFLIAISLLHSRSIPAQLKTALSRREFHIEYLPTIDLSSGRCVGAEALIRWDHPDHGLMQPDTFIPIAESSGLILPITEWILSTVAIDLQKISGLALPADFHIGVNIASQTLSDEIIPITQRIFDARKVALSRVMFELSERGLIDHAEEPVRESIKRLRQLGVRIALDDFGTGSSNLAYLQSFDIDYLKIEKQFIATLGTESVSSGLVKIIAEMGKYLNVTVIAEGIENAKQLELVKSLDIQEGQGWHFSTPLRFGAFKVWLEQRIASHPCTRPGQRAPV